MYFFRRKLYPYLLIAPALIVVLAISLYPTLYSGFLSLHRSRRGVLQYVGLRNFELIFESDTFWNSLRLTAIYGVIYVLVVMLLALSLALIFHRGIRHSGFYMTVIFLPWMLSDIVAGIMWRWMFLPSVGVLQPLLGDTLLLANNAGAMGIVIGASVWRGLAFAMLLLLAGLQTVPRDLGEAAQIDGANQWQVFRWITWPLVLPTTQVAIIFLTVQAINATGLFLSITQGGPGRATEVLSLQMYREAIQFFNFGYGAALAVLMFLINAVLILVYVRALRARNATV